MFGIGWVEVIILGVIAGLLFWRRYHPAAATEPRPFTLGTVREIILMAIIAGLASIGLTALIEELRGMEQPQNYVYEFLRTAGILTVLGLADLYDRRRRTPPSPEISA